MSQKMYVSTTLYFIASLDYSMVVEFRGARSQGCGETIVSSSAYTQLDPTNFVQNIQAAGVDNEGPRSINETFTRSS